VRGQVDRKGQPYYTTAPLPAPFLGRVGYVYSRVDPCGQPDLAVNLVSLVVAGI
jgi:hypothetical protein